MTTTTTTTNIHHIAVARQTKELRRPFARPSPNLMLMAELGAHYAPVEANKRFFRLCFRSARSPPGLASTTTRRSRASTQPSRCRNAN